MSYNSRHMTAELPAFGRRFVKTDYTLEDLRKASWDELLAEDWDLDGNTKWSGDKPSLAFLKNNLFLVKAAADIGYAHPDTCGKVCLARRVRRRGIENLLILLSALMQVGKMPPDCTKLFQIRTKPTKVAVEFANMIISRATKLTGSRKKVLEELGISDSLAKWWERRL